MPIDFMTTLPGLPPLDQLALDGVSRGLSEIFSNVGGPAQFVSEQGGGLGYVLSVVIFAIISGVIFLFLSGSSLAFAILGSAIYVVLHLLAALLVALFRWLQPADRAEHVINSAPESARFPVAMLLGILAVVVAGIFLLLML